MNNDNPQAVHWDAVYDVVVVGSGAGAMTAALRAHDQRLSVLMVEKAAEYGGTTAISGGGIWVPCNHQIEGSVATIRAKRPGPTCVQRSARTTTRRAWTPTWSIAADHLARQVPIEQGERVGARALQ
ncbi:hypothetical protein HMPREF3173_01155 [Pseudomonas sp. HMSC08G10]|nr:hypothetical protein HMPREF3173_01155 [Pseudomonas sp. HMSC08G10]